MRNDSSKGAQSQFCAIRPVGQCSTAEPSLLRPWVYMNHKKLCRLNAGRPCPRGSPEFPAVTFGPPWPSGHVDRRCVGGITLFYKGSRYIEGFCCSCNGAPEAASQLPNPVPPMSDRCPDSLDQAVKQRVCMWRSLRMRSAGQTLQFRARLRMRSAGPPARFITPCPDSPRSSATHTRPGFGLSEQPCAHACTRSCRVHASV